LLCFIFSLEYIYMKYCQLYVVFQAIFVH
jgi:hypothetical protein